jgi:hypothetical protein
MFITLDNAQCVHDHLSYFIVKLILFRAPVLKHIEVELLVHYVTEVGYVNNKSTINITLYYRGDEHQISKGTFTEIIIPCLINIDIL